MNLKCFSMCFVITALVLMFAPAAHAQDPGTMIQCPDGTWTLPIWPCPALQCPGDAGCQGGRPNCAGGRTDGDCGPVTQGQVTVTELFPIEMLMFRVHQAAYRRVMDVADGVQQCPDGNYIPLSQSCQVLGEPRDCPGAPHCSVEEGAPPTCQGGGCQGQASAFKRIKLLASDPCDPAGCNQPCPDSGCVNDGSGYGGTYNCPGAPQCQGGSPDCQGGRCATGDCPPPGIFGPPCTTVYSQGHKGQKVAPAGQNWKDWAAARESKYRVDPKPARVILAGGQSTAADDCGCYSGWSYFLCLIGEADKCKSTGSSGSYSTTKPPVKPTKLYSELTSKQKDSAAEGVEVAASVALRWRQ